MKGINTILLISFFIQTLLIHSQVMVVNGDVAFSSGSIVKVSNSSILTNDSGKLYVDGLLDIDSNFVNYGLVSGQFSKGNIILNGDWENNSTFFHNNSSVTFHGRNQKIFGNEASDFYNLIFRDTGKVILNVMASSFNLDLEDKIFDIQDNTFRILNVDPESILRVSGFVTTNIEGRLYRKMNSQNEYLFPLGSYYPSYYRPLIVSELQMYSNEIGIAFINYNPSIIGLITEEVDMNLMDVNNKFFHRIEASNTGEVEITLPLKTEIEEEKWNSLSYWNNLENYWNLNSTSVDNTLEIHAGFPLSPITQDVVLSSTTNSIFVPNAFTPNVNELNDRFYPVIPSVAKDVTFQIINRWGDLIHEGKDGDLSWNGIAKNGEVVPLGVYQWKLLATINNKEIYKDGLVTVIK